MSKSVNRAKGSQRSRHAVRASAGPWTIYAGRNREQRATLIVALGRTAGSAVARSRIRRIAREVFKKAVTDQAVLLDARLLARSDVGSLPRRQVRADLSRLLARAAGAVASQEVRPGTNA